MPEMNEAQRTALKNLCERYEVEFNESGFLVHALDSFMMPGYVEGWIGDKIFVGCDQEGNISS